ncbi:sporulation integral membrane protein YlbJ [Falsibacillus albus]|uniref:Sporulation integral membrane protein YlbJ n=1 Tax=Falsibacillus albus TaxID=2478915 RepID=A0A3L7K1K6_9BACI|nr:sporulation integral membrane protein YlbJ [Falsibacillus albus]RLQ95851.1 sporulation integral membrane protein YlbJ [Falsibacillus albus]
MVLSKIKTLILAAAITIMAISMIVYPEESFEASIRGLNMWWEIVFPSLLPFFIISEMLIGFGVVKFIGVLLEPFMRPLFKVPGVGGFVWAMGMATGFPSGANLTARLRKEGQLTRIEAERLVCFTNSSNPLFIFGAVSVGFFYNPNLGVILALSHYLGNFTVGLFMRFYGREQTGSKPERKKKPSIRAAFSSLHQTRIKEERPIGKILGDAVVSSIQTLLMIGGFIILFSVINKLLFFLHITSFISIFINGFFHMIDFPEALGIPFISGLFEITLGSKMTSQAEAANLMQQAMTVSFILGFSGFSVQAQVASILANTDIRFKPFFAARILHGFSAACLTFLMWKPLFERFYSTGIPSYSTPVFLHSESRLWKDALEFFIHFGPMITIGALVLYIILYTRKIFIH